MMRCTFAAINALESSVPILRLLGLLYSKLLTKCKIIPCCIAERVDKGYGKLQYAALKLTGIFRFPGLNRASKPWISHPRT